MRKVIIRTVECDIQLTFHSMCQQTAPVALDFLLILPYKVLQYMVVVVKTLFIVSLRKWVKCVYIIVHKLCSI